jgi:competence protein ComEC
MIDVGTGLSILVQGSDFALLYDAGTNDPAEQGSTSSQSDETRAVSYLFAALGPSGGTSCSPPGDDWGQVPTGEVAIDHVFLSHPHNDHGNMLDSILGCYAIGTVWDAGYVNDALFLNAFYEAVADEPHVAFRTARPPPASRRLHDGHVDVQFGSGVDWRQFHPGDAVVLGQDARMTIVHADASASVSTPNVCSVVVRLDLGSVSVLLTGDVEAGGRAAPDEQAGGGEGEMLAGDRALLDVDILQVAHHGSMTSSRSEFIAAVTPSVALVSSGPRAYSGVTLPDPEVMTELRSAAAHVYTTFELDETDGCEDASGDTVADRIGRETGPGGCENWILEF